MRVWGEELFGPVATIFRVPDLDAAIEVANATDFGLGSNVWTSDPQEAERFVDEVVAGAVFVNGMTTSYPELPFGGVLTSGYGRELAAEGIRAFCTVKTLSSEERRLWKEVVSQCRCRLSADPLKKKH